MSNLKAHMQVHDAYRNYPCPVEHCGKSFKREAKVREHLRTKHPEYHQHQQQLTASSPPTNRNPHSAKCRRMSSASDHSSCSGGELGNTTDDDDDLENEEDFITIPNNNIITLQPQTQNQSSSSSAASAAAAIRTPSALQYPYLSPSYFTLPTALNLSQSPISSPSLSSSSSPISSPTSPHSSWQQYLPPITTLFTPTFKADLLLAAAGNQAPLQDPNFFSPYVSLVTMASPDSEITTYREKISVAELLNN